MRYIHYLEETCNDCKLILEQRKRTNNDGRHLSRPSAKDSKKGCPSVLNVVFKR